jgi:hypothetical protein
VTDLAACFVCTRVPARVSEIVAALHNDYGERDLGNSPDTIEEFVYISLTRQTHGQNASRSWDAVQKVGGPQALVSMPEE